MAQRPNEDTEPRVQQLFVGPYRETGMGSQDLAGAGLCVSKRNFMAVFNASCLNVQRDPETGCAYDCGGSNSYESCRQVYFLRQQNQILQQPGSDSTENQAPDNFQAQLDFNRDLITTMQTRINALEQENNLLRSQLQTSHEISYALALVLMVLIAGAIMRRLLLRKGKKVI